MYGRSASPPPGPRLAFSIACWERSKFADVLCPHETFIQEPTDSCPNNFTGAGMTNTECTVTVGGKKHTLVETDQSLLE